jgi:hypothetical protein
MNHHNAPTRTRTMVPKGQRQHEDNRGNTAMHTRSPTRAASTAVARKQSSKKLSWGGASLSGRITWYPSASSSNTVNRCCRAKRSIGQQTDKQNTLLRPLFRTAGKYLGLCGPKTNEILPCKVAVCRSQQANNSWQRRQWTKGLSAIAATDR